MSLFDEGREKIIDYTLRRGVEHTELIFPIGVKLNRNQLWNAAETSEKRKNSTVAREYEVALPEELTQAQKIELAQKFARHLVERYGVAADVSIHAPGKGGDHRNHHAHILTTTRQVTPAGFGAKTRALDDKKTGEVERIREQWATMTNQALENAGHHERVDHRRLSEQGIDRKATKHLGPAATAMERRGERSELGDLNRAIIENGREILALRVALQRELLLWTLGRIHGTKFIAFQEAAEEAQEARKAVSSPEAELKAGKELERVQGAAAAPEMPEAMPEPGEVRKRVQDTAASPENIVGVDVLRKVQEEQEARERQAREEAERGRAEQEKEREEQQRRKQEREDAEDQQRVVRAERKALHQSLYKRYNTTLEVKNKLQIDLDKAKEEYGEPNIERIALEQFNQIPYWKKLFINKKKKIYDIRCEILDEKYKKYLNVLQKFQDANDEHEKVISIMESHGFRNPETIEREKQREQKDTQAPAAFLESIRKAVEDAQDAVASPARAPAALERVPDASQAPAAQEREQEVSPAPVAPERDQPRREAQQRHRKDRGPSRGSGLGM